MDSTPLPLSLLIVEIMDSGGAEVSKHSMFYSIVRYKSSQSSRVEDAPITVLWF